MPKTAIIAMSGGVDSSVAALLMRDAGYRCAGATMKLFDNADAGVPRERSCCSLDDISDAKSVAFTLGMEHYVFNFTDRFKSDVIDRFVCAYERGITPNPCIDCNRYLKFDKFFARARDLGYDLIVTGHYAKIEYDTALGRYLLKKAADPTKDQSYVLYSMTQDQLAHTRFPLGEITKSQAREIAEKHGFINAKKHDSQDICFVQDGKYADFIEGYTGKIYPPGDFVSKDGKVLGRHKGIIRYTIGQRKGLGISAPEPLYVSEIDVEKNTVTLASNAELFTTRLTAKNINLISVDEIKSPMRVKAKIRYRQTEENATVTQTDADTVIVEFDNPQRAVTRGQAVVFYDGDTVVGGGVIR